MKRKQRERVDLSVGLFLLPSATTKRNGDKHKLRFLGTSPTRKKVTKCQLTDTNNSLSLGNRKKFLVFFSLQSNNRFQCNSQNGFFFLKGEEGRKMNSKSENDLLMKEKEGYCSFMS